MRLHRLVITGVGPFKDRQEIDVDTLSSSGLFLIEGATGSGKTTIIDAIVFALFGVVSAGADDVTRMRIRSHYCTDTDPTGVELHFTVDGRRHRITRVPAGARDPEQPNRAATSRSARQVLTEFRDDDNVVLTSADEIRRHVVRLLGMSAEQFRQLVVLPQGQFAELLRQTPNERLKSLSPLLEDSFIAAVQDDLKEQGEIAERQRSDADRVVDRAAQRLAGRVAAHRAPEDSDFTDSTIDDDERTAAADAIVARLGTQASEATSAQQQQQAAVDVHEQSAARAADTLRILTEAEGAALAIGVAREALAAADRDVTESSIDGRLASLHQLTGSLDDHAVWEAAAPQRATSRQVLVSAREECRLSIEKFGEELGEIPKCRAELDEQLQKARELSAGLEAALATRQRQQDLLEQAAVLADLRAREQKLTTDLEQSHARVSADQEKEDAAFELWQRLVLQQRAATAADLAAALSPGEPCLVCGSTEHPNPAVSRTSSGTVTSAAAEADVTAALTAANQARSTTASSRAVVTGTMTELAQVSAKATVIDATLMGSDAAALAADLAAATDAATAAEQAREELPALHEQMTRLGDTERDLVARIAQANTDLAVLDEQIEAHDKAESARAAQIADVIGDAASATELLDRTRSRITALDALSDAWQQLAIATARVPDGVRMTVDEARAGALAAQAELEAVRGLLAAADQLAVTLTSAYQEAGPLVAAFRSAITTRRDVRAATATALDLANLVTAGNPRRLQLRSYALQRRFAAVLAASSGHLSRMSSGKFTFELNDETARSGQAGLGIWLYDSWTGSTQDPKSLSGGETFYASLALALGLADVIRGEAGGSALETLFVDEGFGSLDQDTLHLVLDQLDHLRAGNRAVGVVSHVTEMKESIPDRIEVRRQPDSTSIIVDGSR